MSGRSAGAVRRCDTQWQRKPGNPETRSMPNDLVCVVPVHTFPLIPISDPEELPPACLYLHSAAPSRVEVKEIIGHL